MSQLLQIHCPNSVEENEGAQFCKHTDLEDAVGYGSLVDVPIFVELDKDMLFHGIYAILELLSL